MRLIASSALFKKRAPLLLLGFLAWQCKSRYTSYGTKNSVVSMVTVLSLSRMTLFAAGTLLAACSWEACKEDKPRVVFRIRYVTVYVHHIRKYI